MERAPVRPPVIKHLELKVGLLLAFTLILLLAFAAYALYARGAFERSQTLVLITDNAEGVSVGMSLTFSGFPVGQVKRIALTDAGRARIEINIPVKDARWLREDSLFTLEKSLVGGAKIRAHTGNLDGPPLPDGAEREIYVGDAMEDITAIIQRVRGITENIERMTATDASLNQSLAHVSTITGRMAGEYGVVGGLMGQPENARKVVDAVSEANALLKSLQGVSLKVDGMLAKADEQVFGNAGLLPEAQQAARQVTALLGDLRASLAKVDVILKDTQGATADLATLRAEVDDSLRKVNHLIGEINRKWPFARDVEIKLP